MRERKKERQREREKSEREENHPRNSDAVISQFLNGKWRRERRFNVLRENCEDHFRE